MSPPIDEPGAWSVANPTPARLYGDIWLFAESVFVTLASLLAQMQAQSGGARLPPANMTAVNKALADLQALTQQQ